MKRANPASDSASKEVMKRSCLRLKEMSPSGLVKEFSAVMPVLRDIQCGKVQSERHEVYTDGACNKRNSLKMQSNCICCVTYDQYEAVSALLLSEFCPNDMKLFSYVMDVLYPEGLERVIMSLFNITRQEVISVMYHSLKDFSGDDYVIETESDIPHVEFRQDLIKFIEDQRKHEPVYRLTQLITATGDKSSDNLLGEGGYGSVYKGVLRHTTVAVKFLNKDGLDSVKAELTALTKIRHPNIVAVMGFSAPPVRAIVYEYICGGSLHDRLHEVKVGPLLCWDSRLCILEDTCRGLTYLHTADPPIVHQDIKSHNILIDAHGRAKICDFGFAIELPQVTDGRSMFTAKGFARSEGYYPSELTSGQYSAKSDIYSYGVVMLETFTKLRVYCSERSDPKLVDFVEDDITSLEGFKSIQDSSIPKCSDETVVFLYTLTKRCLMRHSKRPTSSEVMEAWEEAKIIH